MVASAVHAHRFSGVSLVVGEADLDLAHASRLRSVIRDEIGSGSPEVVVDLSTVLMIDAGVAGVLIKQHSRAADRGVTVRAVGASGLVLEVLEMLDLAKPLRAYDPRDSAPARPVAPCCDPDVTVPGGPTPVDGRGDDGHRFPNEQVHALMAEAAWLSAGDPYREQLRARAIEAARPAALRLARRYFDRGEQRQDLLQVASLALVKAVDGYDHTRESVFADYAIPTILGELRRHFRDRGPTIRGPRRLQELRMSMAAAREDLTQELRREPTAAEVAARLGHSEGDVREATKIYSSYRPTSLSIPVGDDQTDLVELLGDRDPGFDLVENQASLRVAMSQLPERLQRILAMRFYGNMNQGEIAAELGLSQMHISRLLHQAFATLRTALLDDSADAAA